MDHAKRSFNRATNCIVGRLGTRRAGIAVIVELIKSKCMPILVYGCEACSLKKRQLASLDFTVVRFGMKIFHCGDRDTVVNKMADLALFLTSVTVPLRQRRFLVKFGESDNILCMQAALGYCV